MNDLIRVEDAGGYGVRVMPKVFSDLPSQTELKDTHEELKTAKKGRAMLLVWTIILGTLLLAAAAFVVFDQVSVHRDLNKQLADLTESSERDREAAAKEAERLNTELGEANRQLNSLSQYAQISDLELQQAEWKTKIGELLRREGFGNQETRLAGPALQPSWAIYRDSATWKAGSTSRDAVESDLRARIDLLKTLHDRVNALTRIVPAPAPRMCGPRPCEQ
jgi:outer membrane murein-binding lipoprotein Lpp